MIYTVADILTGIFEAIIVFMFFDTYLEKNININNIFYIIGTVCLAILINISNHIFNFGMLNGVIMILISLAFSTLFKGKMLNKLILSVLWFVIIALIEIAVLFVMAITFNETITDIVNSKQLRLIGIIISKLATFFIIKIICLRAKKLNIKLSTSYWILFFMMFSSSLLAVWLIFKIQYDNGLFYMYNLSVISCIGLMYSTFFAIYLYENITKQTEIIHQREMLEQQVRSQSKHFDEVLIVQKEIKSIKHDLPNHLISLKSFFEKNQFQEGINYINKITTNTIYVDNSIETGNVALDSILNSKKALAKSKDINFITNIQIPEKVNIDPVDVSIIWGNALDNAIEASEKAENKYIKISIIYGNDAINCKIINSMKPIENPKLKTTKKDKQNHGLGIANIKNVLSKYGNVFKIEQQDKEFILYFIIFQK